MTKQAQETSSPALFYPNFVEISMFRFSEISILVSIVNFRRNQFPAKSHSDFVEILMSKSKF
jgi:hypothetical protein